MAQTLTGPANWGRLALWTAVAVVVAIVAAYLVGAFTVRDQGTAMRSEGAPPAAVPSEQAPPTAVPPATGAQPAVPPSGGQQQ